MVILAFDSGLERTGYAIFKKNGNKHKLIDYGCIITHKTENIEHRIATIHNDVRKLVKKHKPDVFVIEQLFFSKNKKTAIMVAQSQGTVLQLAGKNKIEVAFVTPLQIKLTLTGYGNADKKSVQKMVGILLEMDEMPKLDDTVDAIACGLTYCTINRFDDRKN